MKILFTMISNKSFADMALSFPNTEENPHFDRRAFKVRGKRIFATMLEKDRTVNIFLTPSEQKEISKENPKHIYAVANKWGQKGATTFELKYINKDVLQSALTLAYEAVIDKK